MSYAGETLGRGRFGPRTLLRKWMRSPLHRAVVLSPLAKRIGVGSHLDGSGPDVVQQALAQEHSICAGP